MRFLLDIGSGTCLWREHGALEAHLDYAIDHHAIGLSRNAVAALDALIALADVQIDWTDPTSKGPHWTKELEIQFMALQASTLKTVAAELDVLGLTLSHE